jgi:hypothetical protein
MGTNTTTDSRQVALGTDDADGIAQIALLQFMYPVGNVVADGTSLLTLGDLTVQTALGLGNSLCHRITLVHLLEGVSLLSTHEVYTCISISTFV